MVLYCVLYCTLINYVQQPIQLRTNNTLFLDGFGCGMYYNVFVCVEVFLVSLHGD